MKLNNKYLQFALTFTALMLVFSAGDWLSDLVQKHSEIKEAREASLTCRNEFGRPMECE